VALKDGQVEMDTVIITLLESPTESNVCSKDLTTSGCPFVKFIP